MVAFPDDLDGMTLDLYSVKQVLAPTPNHRTSTPTHRDVLLGSRSMPASGSEAYFTLTAE
jgi:hypothetical protein